MKTFLIFLFALTFNNCFSEAIETKKSDTITYRLMKCGLYMSSQGDICFKTWELLNEEGDKRLRYLTEIYNTNLKDSEWVGTEMKFVVDTLTFKFLSEVFWIDKNNIYVLEPMSDGGHISVLRPVNRKTFTIFKNSWYGKDKNNIYWKSTIVVGADIQSFQVFKNEDLKGYAYDKTFYYFIGKKISDEEAKFKGLDKIKTRNYSSAFRLK